jgi:hypothetical protein
VRGRPRILPVARRHGGGSAPASTGRAEFAPDTLSAKLKATAAAETPSAYARLAEMKPRRI